MFPAHRGSYKSTDSSRERSEMHVLCAPRSIPAGARGVRPGRAAQAAVDVRTSVRNLGPPETRQARISIKHSILGPHEYIITVHSRPHFGSSAIFDENRHASRALEYCTRPDIGRSSDKPSSMQTPSRPMRPLAGIRVIECGSY